LAVQGYKLYVKGKKFATIYIFMEAPAFAQFNENGKAREAEYKRGDERIA